MTFDVVFVFIYLVIFIILMMMMIIIIIITSQYIETQRMSKRPREGAHLANKALDYLLF